MSVTTKCYKTEYNTIYLAWVIPYQINMSLALPFLISLQFGTLKASIENYATPKFDLFHQLPLKL